MGFKQLANFCEEYVRPVANQLDEDPVLLKKIFQKLNREGWLGLFIPKALGGKGGKERQVKAFYSTVAKYSGALLLLYAQHHMAVRWIVERFPESPLRTRTLKNIIEKRWSIGIGFSPLKGQMMAHSIPKKGLYLTGTLPWVTGLRMHKRILVAFRLAPTIRYVLLPFAERANLTIQAAKPLAVFNSTATVSIKLDHYYLSPRIHFHQHHDSQWQSFPHPARYALLGEARALLEIMANSPAMEEEACQQCHKQLSEAVTVVDKRLLDPEEDPYAQRAKMLALAMQCAQAALAAVGGRSVLADHPVQRHYREIMQLAIAGLSAPQQEAYFVGQLSSNT